MQINFEIIQKTIRSISNKCLKIIKQVQYFTIAQQNGDQNKLREKFDFGEMKNL